MICRPDYRMESGCAEPADMHQIVACNCGHAVGHYGGMSKPLPEIARELAVKWIVEGSIVSSSGRLHATAQLIDTSNDEHVWSATYDRRFHDALSLQMDLATVMAGDLQRAMARERVQDDHREAASASGEQPHLDAPADSPPDAGEAPGVNTRP